MHPMWDNESQRLGKQKCTPTGYAIHVIGELLGFFGLLLLIGIIIYLVYKGFAGSFSTALLWLLAVPFGVGFISEFLVQYSWWLALRKGFRYDYDLREASWLEGQIRRYYKYGRD